MPGSPANLLLVHARRGPVLIQAPGLHVVHEASDARLVRNEWACLYARDRLLHIALGARERLECKRRTYANLGLDLSLDVVILEREHAAFGVMYENYLLRAEKTL